MNEPVQDYNQLHLGMKNLSVPIHLCCVSTDHQEEEEKSFTFYTCSLKNIIF